MDIQTARFIDQWLGRPICRILSGIEAVRGPFRSPAPGEPPRSILIIELSEMGSVILAYPMLCEAKRRYPKADLYFLTFEKVKDAVKVLEIIPEEHILTLNDRSVWTLLQSAGGALLRMRRMRPDAVLDMELFARISAIFSYLSGSRRRVGFFRYRMEGLYRGNFLTHRVQYSPYLHIAKNQLALLDALEEDTKKSPLVKRDYNGWKPALPRLRNSPQEESRIRGKLLTRCPELSGQARIVLLNPSGGELPIRAWPLEHYVTLTRLLLEEDNLFVGVIGLKTESNWYEEMARQIDSGRFFDFTGMTEDVREVIQLFNCCQVLVTADSGPAHFAGLSGIHCVVFFGPETPVLYGPIGTNYTCLYSGLSCSPCLTAYNHRNTPCDGDNICVKDFKPHNVRSIVLTALNKASPDYS